MTEPRNWEEAGRAAPVVITVPSDPLDEILEAAGIPAEHPTRALVDRGTHRVVMPAVQYVMPGYVSYPAIVAEYFRKWTAEIDQRGQR